jgi:uncharacterized MAPEG superfamily protein
MSYHLTAIVTLLSLLVYFWMATQVARARRKAGIKAPTMIGDPVLERTIRGHVNTLEWLPIYLPSLWLFAAYWGDVPAAGVGFLWIVGRIVYFRGYVADAAKRSPGFLIQVVACVILLFGALGRAAYLAAGQG